MEYATFDARAERLLVHALAAFLDIPPEAVKVCSVEEGSVKLVVELSADAAEQLLEASESGVISLEDYLDSLGEIKVNAAPEASESSIVETVGSAAQLADLKAQAWRQYADALRVSRRLAEAERAFAEAQRFCENGTGDPLLRADLLTGRASLRISQSRFGEAIALADEACLIYSELDESSSVARTMVPMAVAQLHAGEIDAAVRTLDRAIPLIDSERDPHLLLTACHNLIRCHLDLGQPEQALSLYFEARPLYQEFSDPLIALRAAWQEGQLLRDLGHLRAAETVLLRAREGFQEHDLLYETAMVSLDLVTVYLKLNMVQSLQETVAATVPIFKALGVDREPLAMLLQLGQIGHQSRQAFMLIHELTTRIEEPKSSKFR
jgi:tetratricopeptide (TPR) repeat protein